MSDTTKFFLVVSTVAVLLFIGHLVHAQLKRQEYIRLAKLEEARKAWAKMLEGQQ